MEWYAGHASTPYTPHKRCADYSSTFWSPEVLQAAARHAPVPGVAALQTQYVRYRGCQDSATPSGWLLSESTAALALRRPGKPQPPSPITIGAGLPRQVNLSIVSAPAQFCLPIKRDKFFKPSFQVQVRVLHNPGSPTRLPLRIKAFAVLRDRLRPGLASAWLPCHATTPSTPAAAAGAQHTQHGFGTPCEAGNCMCKRDAIVALQGPVVLPHCFRYTPCLGPPELPGASTDTYISGLSAFNLPALDASTSGGSSTRTHFTTWPPPPHPDAAAGAGMPPPPCPSHYRPLPCNSTAAACAQPLAEPQSMLPHADDPDRADTIAAGDADNVSVAQFEFRQLKFDKTSRMAAVQMVFACVIGEGDLLYAVHHVPTICVSHTQQRCDAAEALGLPRSAHHDVRALEKQLRRLPVPQPWPPPADTARTARKRARSPPPYSCRVVEAPGATFVWEADADAQTGARIGVQGQALLSPVQHAAAGPGMHACAPHPCAAPGMHACAPHPCAAPGMHACAPHPCAAPGMHACAPHPCAAPQAPASSTAGTVPAVLGAGATNAWADDPYAWAGQTYADATCAQGVACAATVHLLGEADASPWSAAAYTGDIAVAEHACAAEAYLLGDTNSDEMRWLESVDLDTDSQFQEFRE
eukprot:jgi/Ulvmu1/903/UM101_0011.1